MSAFRSIGVATILASLIVMIGCEEKSAEQTGSTTGGQSTDKRLARDLDAAGLQALCQRLIPAHARVLSHERECGEAGLYEGTQGGTFSRSACVEAREDCLDQLGPDDGDRSESESCSFVQVLGPRALPSCDITVAEFENCWKRWADSVDLLKCETADARTRAKVMAVEECYDDVIKPKCDPFDD